MSDNTGAIINRDVEAARGCKGSLISREGFKSTLSGYGPDSLVS